MYYSDEIIEEVRSRSDIVDIIGSYVSLKQKGTSYSACCPFHHEKTPSFYVSKDKQVYHCFGCGAAGNVFTFLMEYDNLTFPEAIRQLADRSGISLPEQQLSETERREQNKKQLLKEINRTAAGYFHYLLTKTSHGKKGLDYFHERGLSDETITSFGLGYSDIYENDLYKYLSGKGYKDSDIRDAGLIEISEQKGATDCFWNRVMVPITDINGKVIAFGGRVLGDAKPKYVNTKATAVFDKSRNLFAMNIARRSKRRGIILCEGYMDVIAMHQAGFDNATATLGTAVTLGHAGLVKRYTEEVYLAYDSDEAGTKAALKAIDICREVGLSTRVIDLKPHKDPDEFIKALGREAFEERLRDAKPGIVFAVDTAAKNYRLSDPEDKSRFGREVARILSTIEDAMTRHNYIDSIAETYRLDKDGLKQQVREYGTAAEERRLADEVMRETKPEREKKASAFEQEKSYGLLLTWMVNDTGLFEKLDGIISEEDFPGEGYKDIAHALFEQYRKNGVVNPAALVDIFTETDKQRFAAAVIQAELPEETGPEEREKALNDIVKRVKTERIDRELSEGDLTRMPELIREKSGIDKLHIRL